MSMMHGSVWALLLLLGCTLVQGLTLWPQPASVSRGTVTLSLQASAFAWNITGATNAVLQAAVQRYVALTFWASPIEGARVPLDTSAASGALTSLRIAVASADDSLDFGVDESYNLTVVSGGATLVAPTVWGALHGLEAFSQLVDWQPATRSYEVAATPVFISDAPRFPHRGLLVDTARHYLPLDVLKRAVDGLAYNKMNVLHWHIVDAQSFPYEVPDYPDLAQKGAWYENLTYSASQISDVVSYAKQRGVRVIPEFDMPGHAYSWGYGYPDLIATCPAYEMNINNIPLDPSKSGTFTTVKAILTSAAEVFTDKWVHLGGDEVVEECWLDDASIASWMSSKGFSSGNQVMQYFEDQVQPMAAALGRTVINWEEVFSSGISIPASNVIEVWKDEATLLSVTQANRRALLAYGWYLDHLQLTWVDFYNNEPFQSSSWTPALEALMLGGEAAAWGETLNAANWDPRVFPRTCATAERLWSPRAVNNVTLALPRLVEHVCRLNRRGIQSAPISPGYCLATA